MPAASTIDASPLQLNVADRLREMAAAMPNAVAVACPQRRARQSSRTRRGESGANYATITFAELDADATQIAGSLAAWGVPAGTRLALLVKPGIEFVTLVFALLRAGMVIVLIDPGLGRRNLIRCLAEAEPDGFVAVPLVHAARIWLRKRFPRARWNVTVGRRWFWGGKTLQQLRTDNPQSEIRNPKLPSTSADDPAAIIFTSGSTGPPKGVLYTHRMFDTQVREIQRTYNIEPGGVDLACFPLFALFNSAMGITTVFPKINFSQPALAYPPRLVTAGNDWQITQAFASPAVWRVLSNYCRRSTASVSTLRRIFSCGAPVRADILNETLSFVVKDAKMHTPYGATECLPVATIEAAEVLGETTNFTDQGAGVCVGRKFDSIEWRIVRITDEPIATIDDAEELPPGEIGELIVRGPQASPLYVTRPEANAEAKIVDGSRFWHRMGDVGYIDDVGRFWYCGRKSQRVETSIGPLFTECVEGAFNSHPHVHRSALVGMGPRGDQLAVVCIELTGDKSMRGSRGHCPQSALSDLYAWKSKFAWLAAVHHIHHYPADFPVDVRHNAKILREWIQEYLRYCIVEHPDSFPPELVERAKAMTEQEGYCAGNCSFASVQDAYSR